MANKIIQLKDINGNNLYPVVGYENVYSSTPIRIGGFWFRPNLINE